MKEAQDLDGKELISSEENKTIRLCLKYKDK